VLTVRREHIKIELFTDWLGRRARGLLSCVSHVIGLVFCIPMLWASLRMFGQAWLTGTYYDGFLSIPKWIGYMIFSIGVCLFLFQIIVRLILDVKAITLSLDR